MDISFNLIKTRIGIGLMLSTFLMTFFCYNTATTSLMVPIGLSLLQELEEVIE